MARMIYLQMKLAERRGSLRRVAESGTEEGADLRCDLDGVRLQGEMAGVEEADHGIRNIALERFGTGRQEERVVLAPHRQERRLVRTEVALECRIERDVALVVA